MGLEKFFQTTRPPSSSPSGYQIPAPPKNLVKAARWIPPGETVEVLDYIIRGGMLYVGMGMKDADGTPEPALLNPLCPVALPSRTATPRMLDYWPSYATLSPETRGAYLNWLASGRDDADADIGFVTLYFYGLERRAFIDGYGMPEAAEEWPVLREEVLRLKSVYGAKSFNFKAAANRFLEMMEVAKHPKNLVFGQAKYASSAGGIPLALKKHLGELALAKEPLPAETALEWVHADASMSKPMPVARCKDKFDLLFLRKYAELCKDGIVLPITHTKLMIVYEPASPSVAGFGEIGLFMDETPDVTADGAAAKKLQAIIHLCAADLDDFSRFVGRRPDKKDSLEAELLLPPVLRSQRLLGVLGQWQAEVAAGPKVTTLADILSSFGEDSPEPSRDTLYAALEALFSAEVNIEPDLSGKMPKMTDPIVTFSSTQDDPVLREQAGYVSAKASLLMAQMLMLFEPDKAELQFSFVESQIETRKHLSRPQRARLGAYAHLLRVAPPAAASVKRSMAALDEATRAGVGQFLCKVAHVAGDPALNTIKELSKHYKMLGLSSDSLHSDLHAAASGTSRSKTAGGLDHSRIAALQADTAVVGALLANVFVEETPATVAAEPASEVETTATTAEQRLLGLDDAHSSFARALLTQSHWTRDALCAEAERWGLMADGALEQLNDAAFDVHDMPFVEGDDPYEINPDIAMELTK